MNRQIHRLVSNRGFSLLELVIALAILVIALVPNMNSITSSVQSTSIAEEHIQLVNAVREKMEEIIAMEFNTLSLSTPSGTPTALSDTVTIMGKTVNRNVYVDLYDGNGDSIPDIDLKKLSVVIDDYQQVTLLADF
jgi:prepilin-type N-terminal cleavage/methylation domain-containing protein